jgi:hypothetical protein
MKPARTLLQGCAYVPADKTDIRATFERIRREQCEKQSSSGTSIGSIEPLDMLQLMRVGLPTAARIENFLSDKWMKQ